ncbi:MAG: universal stress protein [Spirochaetes bacterium]|uniref:Universal stress protein n=1 Tax=Candidatus Aphodenecus pullistercoris TaxID=2840669 RepID=A0A9D9HBG5_9SPIR|nr:universal stress protein [Candidatus Aphodenecus pullistercoris]
MSDTFPFRRILVYLDGSEASLSAAMYSVLLAKASGADLHALYVVNTKALQDLVKARIFVSSERSEYLADLNKDAGRHIRHIEKLAKLKGVGVTGQIVEGLPSAQVVKYIKDHSVDLLVLGPVNMIRSRREELTSESDRMLRTAPCPVLVSRDDEKLWQMFEE